MPLASASPKVTTYRWSARASPVVSMLKVYVLFDAKVLEPSTLMAGLTVIASVVMPAVADLNTYRSLMSSWPPSFSTLTLPAESTETWPRLGASRWSAAPTKSGAAPSVRIREAIARGAPHDRARRLRFMVGVTSSGEPTGLDGRNGARQWVWRAPGAAGMGQLGTRHPSFRRWERTWKRDGGSAPSPLRVQSGLVRAG